MIDQDYYEVLGVAADADAVEIRRAYRDRAREYHPDRMQDAPEAERLAGEERLKTVNLAYEVLSNPERRRQYHAEWRRTLSPPVPSVEPPRIHIENAQPGEPQSAYFDVRNTGGPYSSISVSNPESWVRVASYESLSETDELPLRVFIQAAGHGWDARYDDTITVSLDDQESEVAVSLKTAPYTRTAPASGAGARARGRRRSGGARRGQPKYRSIPSRAMSRSIDGATAGIRWGGAVGGVAMALVAAYSVIAANYTAFATALMIPGLAILAALFGAVAGAVLGALGGSIAGLVYGTFTKSETKGIDTTPD